MTLRDGIEAVPWAQLSHAYGPAEDTPSHLFSLLSDDPEEFARALDELWASICHQGSVYEASCAAVPPLIEILRRVSDDRKPALLYLLAGLAHRDFYAIRDLRILGITTSEIGWRKRQEWWSVGAFLEEGNEFHEAQWTRLAHARVAEGIPVYVALLQSTDREVVIASLYLLSAFREVGASPREAIRVLLDDQPSDVFVEASALLSFGPLLEDASATWDRYAGYLKPNVHPLVRYAAAATIARHHPKGTSEAMVETLIETMVRPEQIDELHELLPWHDNSVHVEACWLLGRLDAPWAIGALTMALERGTSRWRIVDTVRVAEALLDVAFFGGWISGRMWDYSTDLTGHTVDSMARELFITGDMRSYEERSYHRYGRSQIINGQFKIHCYGYVEEEADRLRERIDEDGNAWLSRDQWQALEAILHCEPLWSVEHNLLSIYGLPNRWQALEKLLDSDQGRDS
jgi:hypothetical protein